MTPERFHKLTRVLAARQPDLTVIMENVHKSHNIGAIVRTCDAVGILGIHAVSPDGEVRRHHMVSGGTRRYVRTTLHPDIDAAVADVKASGHRVIAAHLSDEAESYLDMDYTGPTALLMGSELWGVGERAAELADGHVAIPMHGLVASLNVSVAAALILYEARRQREAAGLYARSRIDPAEFQRILFEWAYPDLARRCRDRGLPYPPLDADGDLAANPFD